MYMCSVRLCAILSSLCGSSKLQLYVSSLYITNRLVTAFCVFMALWCLSLWFPSTILFLLRSLAWKYGLCWGGRWVVWPLGRCRVFFFFWVWDGVFYGWWGFSRASKILLGCIVCSSFRWLFLENSAYMWYHSAVLRWVPLTWYCRGCIVFWMGPNECDCSMMCLA